MSDFYAAVFGAGICGTAIANELNKKGKRVLLVDPYVSENAPGPPAGLVNPATGMRAKLCWNGKACYDALRNQIETLIEYSGCNDLISDTGVLRPAINEKLAKNFKKALDKYDWPEGWVRWMGEEEIQELNPEIAPNLGGLYLECGYTVYVDNYLNTYRKYLREQGVTCRYEEADYCYNSSSGQFTIEVGEEEITADHLIVAAGYRTPEFEEWSGLPLEGVKGQIVQFEAQEDLAWDHAVSAKGYSMRRGKRQLIVGSTYEHNFDSLDTTEEAYERIAGKLDIMFADISSKLTKQVQMAGVRVTTPNRLPVIGRHPEQEQLCIYTGMNSKGLLFSHHVASLLTKHLVDGEEIPEELNVRRFED
ncbi:NAD(P)/FAD-dependent oxidoreductase [Fodinibius halophilus]|uniref:FAD-binding oxidoreductase n=1 Tax=Fodinibius halophilus TaxID=1736908 RepID=A0A6M1T421_9BACT|nr:FAD-binding oxidoreductase [Fodinibius halophilus]NGP86721.1 FAD-binding oxidoreductase [Fodinibius halophilus]